MSTLILEPMRAARAATDLQRIAAAVAPAGSVKAKVRAAQEATGLSYNRTRDLWYRRARRIDDAELARIEAVLPSGSPELPLAYLRSVERRVAGVLDELRTLLEHLEAGEDAGEPRSEGGRGHAPDRP